MRLCVRVFLCSIPDSSSLLVPRTLTRRVVHTSTSSLDSKEKKKKKKNNKTVLKVKSYNYFIVKFFMRLSTYKSKPKRICIHIYWMWLLLERWARMVERASRSERNKIIIKNTYYIYFSSVFFSLHFPHSLIWKVEWNGFGWNRIAFGLCVRDAKWATSSSLLSLTTAPKKKQTAFLNER